MAVEGKFLANLNLMVQTADDRGVKKVEPQTVCQHELHPGPITVAVLEKREAWAIDSADSSIACRWGFDLNSISKPRDFNGEEGPERRSRTSEK